MKHLKFVWWGFPPVRWGYWKYPRSETYYQTFKKPIFYGFLFGIFELRYFPVKSGLVNLAKALVGIPIDEMQDG